MSNPNDNWHYKQIPEPTLGDRIMIFVLVIISALFWRKRK